MLELTYQATFEFSNLSNHLCKTNFFVVFTVCTHINMYLHTHLCTYVCIYMFLHYTDTYLDTQHCVFGGPMSEAYRQKWLKSINAWFSQLSDSLPTNENRYIYTNVCLKKRTDTGRKDPLLLSFSAFQNASFGPSKRRTSR